MFFLQSLGVSRSALVMHMETPKIEDPNQVNPPQLARVLNSTATAYSRGRCGSWTAVSARALELMSWTFGTELFRL